MYKYYGAPAVPFREAEAAEAAALAAAERKRQKQAAAAAAPRKVPREVIMKLSKVACEVCKRQVHTLSNLRIHKTGKNHKKNLKKLQDSITPKQENPLNDAVGASTAPAAAVADGLMPAVEPKENKSSAATPEDLEVKKRRVLEAGAAQGELKICTMSDVAKKIPKVVQPVTCEVCKIQCTSLDSLRGHETGKKHSNNLKKLQDSITSEPAKHPNGAVGASTEPAAAAASLADGVVPAVQPKRNKRSTATPEDLEVKKRRVLEAGAAQGELKICTMSDVVKKIPKVVQPVTCEVCKIQCTSLGNLRGHETGKRHSYNLKKLQDSITSEPAKHPNGAVGASTEPAAAAALADGVVPAVQPKKNKRSAATPEDLEVKKRRVLEAGAAQGELKICTMSDVVKKTPNVVQPVICEVCKIQCTSLNNLRCHETSKKHSNNLKKLQDSITSEPAKHPNGAVGASTEPAAAAALADGVVPAVQPKKNKRSAASPEDLEVKKRRVLEHVEYLEVK